MSWDPIWESVFSSQAWGKYPGEDLIRFVARNFYSAADRSKVRVLEVGSGTGANLWFLAREGFSAWGMEGSATAAGIARERLDSECPGWNRPPRWGGVVTGDIIQLPWEGEMFDAAIDSEAVYCNDFAQSCSIYREMYRVTRPGGKLFVRTFATGSWGDGVGEPLDRGRFRADSGPLAGKGASRFTSREELAELLGPWRIADVYVITRTLDSERHIVKEWIVEGDRS